MPKKLATQRAAAFFVNNTSTSAGSYYITSNQTNNTLQIGQGNTLGENLVLSIAKDSLTVVQDIVAPTMQQYISVTLTSDTDPDDDEYNPFIYGKCGGCTYNFNASSGITFNETSGRFTVLKAGVYEITAVIYMNGSTTALTSFKLRKNDTEDIWSAETFVHGSVDPVERTMNGIFTLSASDYIEVRVHGNDISVRNGSGVCIKRIA